MHIQFIEGKIQGLEGGQPASPDVELGEGLSPAVEAALPRVADIVVDLVERHRAAE